uniref:SWIM-type domain-containing protein n=1 Tax=Magallana gigas TaxID=29159 RepID=A0A8W8JLA5_MAGGI
MRKGETPHRLTVDLSDSAVTDAYCSCTAGVSGKCSHIVGLTECIQQFKVLGLKDVPTEQSCTSLPQQWNIPRGNKIQPVSINEVLVVKAKETHKKVPVLPKEIKSRVPELTERSHQMLKSFDGLPISKLNTIHVPTIKSEFGDVKLGSALSYQVCNTIHCSYIIIQQKEST